MNKQLIPRPDKKLVKNCIDCNTTMPKRSKHHYRCNNCWSIAKIVPKHIKDEVRRKRKQLKKIREENNKMEKFKATKYDGKNIELESIEQMAKLYELAEKEQNFILVWNEDSEEKAITKIGVDVFPKIKTGDIILTAREKKR